jgi:hypothetical protein
LKIKINRIDNQKENKNMTAEEARMAAAWNGISEQIQDEILWAISYGHRETTTLNRPNINEIDNLKTLGYDVDDDDDEIITIKW